MSQELLLDYYLKRLRLPTVRRLYKEVARDAAEHNKTFEEFLAALLEQEVIQREENQLRRRLKTAGFPVAKTLESFDFSAIPNVSKPKILALSNGEFIQETVSAGACAAC